MYWTGKVPTSRSSSVSDMSILFSDSSSRICDWAETLSFVIDWTMCLVESSAPCARDAGGYRSHFSPAISSRSCFVEPRGVVVLSTFRNSPSSGLAGVSGRLRFELFRRRSSSAARSSRLWRSSSIVPLAGC